ncbi:MAG: acyl carrier protein [Bacteroidota bacterium]
MDENKNKVIEILKKYTFNESVWDNYTENSKIIVDLKINSARIVDIILDVEDEYGIVIDDYLLEKLITIKDILDIIEQKRK